MLIQYFNENERLEIRDTDKLIELIKAGVLNKDSRVYDAEAEVYTSLAEIQEVKNIALDPSVNEYLGLNVEGIKSEIKRKKNRKQNELVSDIISLALLISGLMINISHTISRMKSFSVLGVSSFVKGQIIGGLIGRGVIITLIWVVIWSKSKKSHKKALLLIFSVISFVFLSMIA